MKRIDVVLVGAGGRANVYSAYALKKPENMRVVGLVEPDDVRMKFMRERYDVPEENCFSNLEDFLRRENFADAVINGTMDQLHVETSIPVLEKGYDLLLEKPFCTNEEDLWRLQKVAERTGRKVMICHVLRYTPYYSAIKKHILDGEIGDVVSMQLSEHVAYHHFGVSYVRGKWAQESVCGSPFLLAKSCHDIDLMMWLKGGTKPVSVASFGADYKFTPDKKPVGAGKYCLLDCPAEVEKNCIYSARQNYLEPEMHWTHHFTRLLKGKEATYDNCKEILMSKDNNYGRCMWDCEHEVVDNQGVIVNFEDGTTGTFTLVGAATKAERNLHIVGTKGEIKGVFEDSRYIIRKPISNNTFEEIVYDLGDLGDMSGEYGGHGGGDLRLVEDFVFILNGVEPSISYTSLEDSIYSHLTVFRAEKARKNKTIEPVF